jgi:tellurite resistance protein
MLTAVAEADGLVDGRERAALHQIAVELGLP